MNLNGDYNATAGGPYYVTTNAIDCTGRTDVQLSFWRWLNTDASPYVTDTVEVSNNGSTWVTVYTNPSNAPVTDNSWQLMQYDIHAVADNQPTVYVRWSYSVSATAYPYSGWNIDDVSLSAPGSCGSDYYSLTLAAGQSATMGLSSLAPAGSTNLIVNGGFETGDFSGWTLENTGSGTFVINNGTYHPLGPTGLCRHSTVPTTPCRNKPARAQRSYTKMSRFPREPTPFYSGKIRSGTGHLPSRTRTKSSASRSGTPMTKCLPPYSQPSRATRSYNLGRHEAPIFPLSPVKRCGLPSS